MNLDTQGPAVTLYSIVAKKEYGAIVEKIKNLVSANPGIKAMEIISKLEKENKSDTSISLILEEMVRVNVLIELEYILPTMDFRIKSMYFPKGTTFP